MDQLSKSKKIEQTEVAALLANLKVACVKARLRLEDDIIGIDSTDSHRNPSLADSELKSDLERMVLAIREIENI